MKPSRHQSTVPHLRAAAAVATLVALLASGVLFPLGGAHAATTVPLHTTEGFAVLAGSTITNTGPSTVSGDIGLHPGSSVTGFGPGADVVVQDGSLHIADGVALQAKNDLTRAYTNAAGQTPVTEIPTELGGSTLTQGAYDSASGTFGLTGSLTLDGQGDAGAVFIFQTASTLVTAAASSVNVINGADLCNVFWQVGSSATLGTSSVFRGTVLADQSITLGNGATVQGRLLASSGAVTMDTNTISNAACITSTGDEDGTDSPDDNDTPAEVETPDEVDTPDETDVPDEVDTPDETDVPDEVETPDETSTPEDTDVPAGDGTSDGAGTPDETDTPEAGSTPVDGGTPVANDGPEGSGTPETVDTPIETSTPGETQTPDDLTTTGQVRDVPGGAVAAGGIGIDTGAGDGSMWLFALLLLVVLSTTMGVAAHRGPRLGDA